MINDSLSASAASSSSDDEGENSFARREKGGQIDEENNADVFKILVTTDNHLGFMEKDPERGEDSFIAFEEALEIAKREEVDFILLGGDLFHENKPSRDCLTKCQKMLREHCFGTKPIEFDIVSDESVNFGHTGFPHANFNDPNLNVSIPVFSIHGNHDDPTGASNLCAMDTLAAAGLVNYFGKSNAADQNTAQSTSKIDIKPVLLQKGCTKLAIFGLGAIKDERLHNMFEKGNVEFTRPSEGEEDWFNVFVIHQNRSAHGKKNYIPEGFLANFLDLVIWGHEHECRIRPEYNDLTEFFVCQPGSSVITSLSESEVAPKHVAILKVHNKNFKIEPVPLRSVRPFMLDTIVLSDQTNLSETDKNVEIKIEQILVKRVNRMIDECNKNRTYVYDKQPTKPLIRLKVDYTNFEPISEIRFAQKFADKVGNPKNLLQFFKRPAKSEQNEEGMLDHEAAKVLKMHGNSEPLEYVKVQDLVSKYFKKAEDRNKMQVLTEKGVSGAIKEFIEKDERDAISELINFQIEKIQKFLKSKCGKFQSDYIINEEIKKFQQLRVTNNEEEDNEIKEIFENRSKSTQQTQASSRSRAKKPSTLQQDDDDLDDEEEIVPSKQRKAPSAKSNNDSDQDIFASDDDDDLGLDDEAPKATKEAAEKPARGRGRGRGGRGSRGGRGGSATTAKTSTTSQKSLFEPVTKSKSATQQSTQKYSQQIFGTNNAAVKKSSTGSKLVSKMMADDSEDEVVIEEDDNHDVVDDDLPSTTSGNVIIPNSFVQGGRKPAATSAKTNLTQTQTQTTQQQQRSNSTRRTRIDYEDGSDEEMMVLQSKKPKPAAGESSQAKPFSLFSSKKK